MINEKITVQPNNNDTLTYTVAEISKILNISIRSAYNLCHSKPSFKVLQIGRSVRINKKSFDRWFNDCNMAAE